MIRRTLILCAALLAAACLGAGAAAPARAASPNDADARARSWPSAASSTARAPRSYFTYPQPSTVRPGHLGGAWWPTDPWTGQRHDAPASASGHYTYTVTRRPPALPPGRLPRRRRRHPHGRHAAIDHARLRPSQRRGHQPHPPVHRGLRRRPRRRLPAARRGERRRRRRQRAPAPLLAEQSVGPLRHGAARRPRLLLLRRWRPTGRRTPCVCTAPSRTTTCSPERPSPAPGSSCSTSLEDEILRRSGKILAGYVDQWSLQHAGTLPTVAELAPTAAVGAAHADWPQDLTSGAAMQPGTGPGRLHATRPAPPAPTRSPSISTPATSRPAASRRRWRRRRAAPAPSEP